ncbi:polyribonucleotide nucleotidyltransferase, partial [Bacillus cereus]|nr:polyribonucleotide nucleotidyltransferase [Bacillus cereus]
DEIKNIVAVIEQLVQVAGKEKMQVKLHAVDEKVNSEVRAYAAERLMEAVKIAEKHARQEAIDAVNEETVAHFESQYIETPELLSDVSEVL